MIRYLLQDRTDNKNALGLFILFVILYIAINTPYLLFMDRQADLVAAHNPFYGVKFGLNLFNFDPAMYYGYDNVSVIHPYKNIIAGPLGALANNGPGNVLFLIIQSALNAGGTALLYYILRRQRTGRAPSALIASLFGISSYSLFTSLIPDSYPYAQFGLVISVFCLQYYRDSKQSPIFPLAILGIVNFGITATNLIPYIGALIIQQMGRRAKAAVRTLLMVLSVFILLAIVLLLIQLVLPGGVTWVSSWQSGLKNGGFGYVAPFSLAHHWKAIYMLGISPLLTPNVTLIDTGITAIATDLSQSYPIYVSVIGFLFLAGALTGWIRGIRKLEGWIPMMFIGFAFCLHLIVGYGLATFNYDLYLYAGHFWFAFFLLISISVRSIINPRLYKAIIGLLVVVVLVTAVHNLLQHAHVLKDIRQGYVTLSEGSGR
ncbi:hypothetical protein [Paenibacillus donghaensis]|uniref:hypothetical protein n=1 Tax=Paenibacillus donghaensis TaxID=414771 RepID=UPI001470DEDA|nr:hypothetical protein [Paenibacillus donghaensis]